MSGIQIWEKPSNVKQWNEFHQIISLTYCRGRRGTSIVRQVQNEQTWLRGKFGWKILYRRRQTDSWDRQTQTGRERQRDRDSIRDTCREMESDRETVTVRVTEIERERQTDGDSARDREQGARKGSGEEIDVQEAGDAEIWKLVLFEGGVGGDKWVL